MNINSIYFSKSYKNSSLNSSNTQPYHHNPALTDISNKPAKIKVDFINPCMIAGNGILFKGNITLKKSLIFPSSYINSLSETQKRVLKKISDYINKNKDKFNLNEFAATINSELKEKYEPRISAKRFFEEIDLLTQDELFIKAKLETQGLMKKVDQYRYALKLKQKSSNIYNESGKQFYYTKIQTLISKFLKENNISQDEFDSINTDLVNRLNQELNERCQQFSIFNKKDKESNSPYSSYIDTCVGEYFENIAASEVDKQIIPQIASKIATKEGISLQKAKSELVQLRNVCMESNCTKIAEFDHIIIRVKNKPDLVLYDPEVVGIVETKLNLKKVLGSFHDKKNRLSIITGNQFSLNYYFDEQSLKGAGADNDGRLYILSPESFNNFNSKKNENWYANLYFISTYTAPKKIANSFIGDEEFLNKYNKPDLRDNLYLINRDISGIDLLPAMLYSLLE